MPGHPAHSLALTVQLAAEELSHYTDPAEPLSARLIPDGHAEILERLHWALSHLGGTVRHIAAAESQIPAQEGLVTAASLIAEACGHLGTAPPAVAASRTLGPNPSVTAEPVHQATTGFPQPIAGQPAHAAGEAQSQGLTDRVSRQSLRRT